METVTITMLEQGNVTDPIWALNSAAESAAGKPGDVLIGIPNRAGKVDPLVLPQSWLAVCLTDQVPRRQLLDSTEFRKAVQNRSIKLISVSTAEAINSSEDAPAERDRLDEQQRRVRDAVANRTIADSGAEIITMEELNDREKANGSTVSLVNQDRDEKERDAVQAKAASDLDPGFVMFVNSLEVKSDAEALNLIKGRGSVRRSELEYIVRTLKNKPKTVGFLSARLGAPKAARK